MSSRLDVARLVMLGDAPSSSRANVLDAMPARRHRLPPGRGALGGPESGRSPPGPGLPHKTRLDALRIKIASVELTEEKLRVARAVEVLERIGSPEAKQALTLLGDGAPGAFSTKVAQEALHRLK